MHSRRLIKMHQRNAKPGVCTKTGNGLCLCTGIGGSKECQNKMISHRPRHSLGDHLLMLSSDTVCVERTPVVQETNVLALALVLYRHAERGVLSPSTRFSSRRHLQLEHDQAKEPHSSVENTEE